MGIGKHLIAMAVFTTGFEIQLVFQLHPDLC